MQPPFLSSVCLLFGGLLLCSFIYATPQDGDSTPMEKRGGRQKRALGLGLIIGSILKKSAFLSSYKAYSTQRPPTVKTTTTRAPPPLPPPTAFGGAYRFGYVPAFFPRIPPNGFINFEDGDDNDDADPSMSMMTTATTRRTTKRMPRPPTTSLPTSPGAAMRMPKFKVPPNMVFTGLPNSIHRFPNNGFFPTFGRLPKQHTFDGLDYDYDNFGQLGPQKQRTRKPNVNSNVIPRPKDTFSNAGNTNPVSPDDQPDDQPDMEDTEDTENTEDTHDTAEPAEENEETGDNLTNAINSTAPNENSQTNISQLPLETPGSETDASSASQQQHFPPLSSQFHPLFQSGFDGHKGTNQQPYYVQPPLAPPPTGTAPTGPGFYNSVQHFRNPYSNIQTNIQGSYY